MNSFLIPLIILLQENNTEGELLNTLKYVRPGNNFQPKMELFGKVEVNGKDTHDVFKVRTVVTYKICACV